MSESEFAARLASRARAFGLSLTAAQAYQFEEFYRLLSKWNPRINLTALALGLTPPPDTIDRLFIEPLLGASMIPDGRISVVDLGSGAGSPAIPLKILRPHIKMTMVETRGRKAAFLREAIRTVELEDVNVLGMRFQALPGDLSGTVDVVTVRALRADSELLATVRQLLKPGGRFVMFGSADAPHRFTILERRPLPNGSTVIACAPTPSEASSS